MHVSRLTKLICLRNANNINLKWSFVRENEVISFAVSVMNIFILRLNSLSQYVWIESILNVSSFFSSNKIKKSKNNTTDKSLQKAR